MEDVEEKRKIPVKVLWALAAGAAALLLLWLTGVMNRDAGEPQFTGQEKGTETTAALRPQVHALRPAIVKLKLLIEKDPNRSPETDEE